MIRYILFGVGCFCAGGLCWEWIDRKHNKIAKYLIEQQKELISTLNQIIKTQEETLLTKDEIIKLLKDVIKEDLK